MKLNLGCGNDYLDGFINVDKGECKTDIQHDLFIFPWPFKDSCADEILLKHMFEHFDQHKFIDVVRELYRISHHETIIHIVCPYAGSDNYWTDPTHRMPVTSRTFDFFDRNKPLFENGKIYGWHDVNFKVESKILSNPPNGPDIYHKLTVIK